MRKTDTYRLPTEKAIHYTKRWRKLEEKNPKDPGCKIRAFTMHLVELQEILDELKVKKVRFYLGINDKEKETLVMVGVDKHNRDMVEINVLEGEEEVKIPGTYDFTHGCPDTCADGDSPLNQDV